MKVLQLIFYVCYFFLIIGCSSESDKTTPDESIKENISDKTAPDESIKENILAPQIKSLEKVAEVNTLIQNSTDNLRENIEKQTDSEFVEDSVEVVPWDIVPGKNWTKPTWEGENWTEDIESK